CARKAQLGGFAYW
nr:immunoglobulin heavy chain junction region [Mus musculus]NSM05908.1 immunoglobulin heavy chain junction region [Mus musculus]NSM06389.1 immunoglobulin heavy chain junction region [Mus musculus]NSM08151.1 immunoglobulin heavy chain junction region [Mus musculus]